MDRLTKEQRSRLMSRIRSVSEMERIARPLATKRAGVSLRHQPRGVPGRPDYANKTRRVAVFVHGCFWHQPCPYRCAKIPATRRRFWTEKFRRNRERHLQAKRALRREGYRIIEVWEHEVSRYARRAGGRSSRS